MTQSNTCLIEPEFCRLRIFSGLTEFFKILSFKMSMMLLFLEEEHWSDVSAVLPEACLLVTSEYPQVQNAVQL